MRPPDHGIKWFTLSWQAIDRWTRCVHITEAQDERYIADIGGKTSVNDDSKALVGDVSRLRGEVSKLAELVHQRLSDAEADVVRTTRRMGTRARTMAERDAGQVIDEIKDNPAASISVVLAIGVLLEIFFVVRSR